MSRMSLNESKPAIEFKGNLLTLMVLHLLETDPGKIAEQLEEKIAKAPGFFQHAPVIIDLHAVQDDNNSDENDDEDKDDEDKDDENKDDEDDDNDDSKRAVDLPELVQLLRSHGLIPVAVRGGNPQQHETALSINLGLLSDAKSIRSRHYPEPEPPEPVEIIVPSMTKMITQPIRSGQQVVALQGDLIVLSTVSHGAEILAHRHVHVYGALRGRALAGVNGDSEARIFCQQLDAELISIAGRYQVNEDLPENLRGKPVQIYLEDDSLKIEPL